MDSKNVGPSTAGHRPRGAIPAMARERRVLLRKEVILANSQSGAGGTGNFRFSIPSSRLRAKLAIGWWSTNGNYPDQSLSTIADLTPYVLDARGVETKMDPVAIAAGATLPHAFDMVIAADGFTCNVTIVGDPGPPLPEGNFKAVVTWEPTNEMSADEWTAVQEECILVRTTKIFGTTGA